MDSASALSKTIAPSDRTCSELNNLWIHLVVNITTTIITDISVEWSTGMEHWNGALE
jgi:hypothetical protein